MLLEKHEEEVEEYYFKVYAKDDKVDMHQWLCISRLKGLYLQIVEVYIFF